jgi:lipid-A-disaccharide synthase
LIAVLPGSRRSEALRHLPELKRAANLLSEGRKLSFVLPASPTCGYSFFLMPLAGSPIQCIEGDAWDAMAHCDVALTASGTVTVEAALLGAPMVTYYKVTELTATILRVLVKLPFFSMVNLIAERKVVPELMQESMTGENLAAETARLLDNQQERDNMKVDLAQVAALLATESDVMARAADEVERVWESAK